MGKITATLKRCQDINLGQIGDFILFLVFNNILSQISRDSSPYHSPIGVFGLVAKNRTSTSYTHLIAYELTISQLGEYVYCLKLLKWTLDGARIFDRMINFLLEFTIPE